MGRLFLKLYATIALALVIFIIGVLNLNNILNAKIENHLRTLSRGTHYLLQQRFTQTPSSNWTALVEEINQGQGYPLRLLRLSDLDLPESAHNRLLKHQFVIQQRHDADFGYQRIQSSEYVLEIPYNESMYVHNQRLSNSTFNLIETELRSVPAAQWSERVVSIAKHFSFPVTIVDWNSLRMSDQQTQVFDQGEVVWEEIDASEEYLYRRIGDSHLAVRLGNFREPFMLHNLDSILLGVMAALVALAVWLWVFPLWRDLKRLGVTAHALGQGQFHSRAPLPKRSALHPLAVALNGMAEKIQRLIASHKELTNAVSHELRTPIARLRFAADMLEQASDPANQKRYLTSMQTDITELDHLVAELLTYARFDRDKPNLEFQRIPISPWLHEVIEMSKLGNEHLHFESKIVKTHLRNVRLEPRLMARALGNLLQNARRFARKNICVHVDQSPQEYVIRVDDDGEGIPESVREKIFQAFSRLDPSRDRDTGGYGLGLAIVQRILQWHGGYATVSDSPLGGARFELHWPIDAQALDVSATG